MANNSVHTTFLSFFPLAALPAQVLWV